MIFYVSQIWDSNHLNMKTFSELQKHAEALARMSKHNPKTFCALEVIPNRMARAEHFSTVTLKWTFDDES